MEATECDSFAELGTLAPHGATTGGAGGASSGQAGATTPSLLVVLGEVANAQQHQLVLKRLAAELQTWDAEGSGCDLNEHLQEFVASAPAATEGQSGELVLEHSTDSLRVQVLINPVLRTVIARLRSFLLAGGVYRHLVYSGRALQRSGCWVLQDAVLPCAVLAELLRGTEALNAMKAGVLTGAVNLGVFAEGDWAHAAKLAPQLQVTVNRPAPPTPPSPALSQFAEHVCTNLPVAPVEQLLRATTVVGNIRFTRPTLYVFPGAQGDSSLFGVSGFNLLVDGGYARRSCFWDFTRHLDRIDAMLVTHVGADNLFGVSSVLARKSRELGLHPEIGYVYMNAVDGKGKGTPSDEATSDSSSAGGNNERSLLVNIGQEATAIVDDLRRLGLPPRPLMAPAGTAAPQPVNLYHKVGHGSLDVYALNPTQDAKATKDFMVAWSKHGDGFTAGKGVPVPPSHATSVCALLVWRPASSSERITRVLYTGAAPQGVVFEGLARLKGVGMFQHAACTENAMNTAHKGPAGGPVRKSSIKNSAAVPPPISQPKTTSVAKPEPSNSSAAQPKQPKGAPAPVKADAAKDAKKVAAVKKEGSGKATSPTKPHAPKELKHPATEASMAGAAAVPVSSDAALAPVVAGGKGFSSVEGDPSNAATLDESPEQVHVAVASGMYAEPGGEEPVPNLIDMSPGAEQSDAANSQSSGGGEQHPGQEEEPSQGAGTQSGEEGGHEDFELDPAQQDMVYEDHGHEGMEDHGHQEQEHEEYEREGLEHEGIDHEGVVEHEGFQHGVVQGDEHSLEHHGGLEHHEVLGHHGGLEYHEDLEHHEDLGHQEDLGDQEDLGHHEGLEHDGGLAHHGGLEHSENNGYTHAGPGGVDMDKDVDTAEDASPADSHTVEPGDQLHGFDGESPKGLPHPPEIGSIMREDSLEDTAESVNEAHHQLVLEEQQELGSWLGTKDVAGVNAAVEQVDGHADALLDIASLHAGGVSAGVNPFLGMPDSEEIDIGDVILEDGSLAASDKASPRQMDQGDGGNVLERDSLERDDGFNAEAQWGQPMGLPAPNRLPGAKNEPDGDKSMGDKKADAKKSGGATIATVKPSAAAGKAPTNGKDQGVGKDDAAKANESMRKPPAALGKKSRPSSTTPLDPHATTSKVSEPSKPASARPAAIKKPAPAIAAAAGGKAAGALKPVVPFYVDLAYIPGHGGAPYVDGEFFRRVRARYYVLSALSPDPALLSALLDAKATWEDSDSTEVTLIPTYDADVLRFWMGAHRDAMSRMKVEVAPSANRCFIQLQDHETSCAAFRLEF